jgi:hypothetical protein
MDMTRYEMETLRDQIASLTKLQHIEIFKVLKRHDVKYTENNDGVFIFCSHIPSDALEEIKQYLDYSNKVSEMLA